MSDDSQMFFKCSGNIGSTPEKEKIQTFIDSVILFINLIINKADKKDCCPLDQIYWIYYLRSVWCLNSHRVILQFRVWT